MASLVTTDQSELIGVLQSSLYPGVSTASVQLVLAYCHAAKLDPMQKPVHIVPMWDSKAGAMRDVVLPGVNLYRIQASRTGEFVGMSEPDFGPDVDAHLGGVSITYPSWCRVTVKRNVRGVVAEFTALEYWIENYAAKGGKEKSVAPNAMWSKRPRGQLAKCASAQALRVAFPELASAMTAEELEGKSIGADADPAPRAPEISSELLAAAKTSAKDGEAALSAWWSSITKSERQALAAELRDLKEYAKAADAERTVDAGLNEGGDQ